MKILSHQADPKNHVYSFVVTPDDGVWSKEINKVVAKAAKQVRLKGYRPGKVPPNIAIKYLNKDLIIRQTLPKIAQEIYKQLLENKEVITKDIIEDSYKIKADKVDLNNIELTYSFNMIPKVTIKDYKDIKGIKVKKQTVTDKEVEDSLKEFAGDKKLDDKFVKSLNLKDIKTLDDLKKYQKQILIWKKDEKQFVELRKKVGEEIVKRTTIDYIPEDILRQEESLLMRQYSTNQNGARDVLNSMVKDDEEGKKLSLNDKIKKMALYTVTLSLALEKIMEDNDLYLTEEDKKKFYEKLAFTNRISIDEAKKKLVGDQNEALMLNEKILKAVIEMNTKK